MEALERTIAIVVAAGLVLGGCAGLTGRSAGRYIDDKVTTAKVKTRIATVDAATLTRVNVDTYNGTVYLNGIVGNEDEKRRIEERARQDGHQVVSNLQIREHRTAATRGHPAASPAMERREQTAAMPAGMVQGEVADVDHGTGMVKVRTADGTMDLHLAPSAVTNLRPGDRVRVSLTPESPR
jgi:translation initiation factor IF-1